MNLPNPPAERLSCADGYCLLFSRLNTMVRAAGLNPYLGFLHDGADDYEIGSGYDNWSCRREADYRITWGFFS